MSTSLHVVKREIVAAGAALAPRLAEHEAIGADAAEGRPGAGEVLVLVPRVRGVGEVATHHHADATGIYVLELP